MSFDFGDMNNDGRIDYVDQKLFDMYCNPNSSDYEGTDYSYQPSSSYSTSVGKVSLTDTIRFLPHSLVLVLMVTIFASVEESILGIFLAVPVLAVWMICRGIYVKKGNSLAAEQQMKRRKLILSIWIGFIGMAACLLVAAAVFSESKESFMISSIDPYSGKVGKQITWNEWDARWDHYWALSRRAGLCLGAGLSFGAAGGLGYWLDWKARKKVEDQIAAKRDEDSAVEEPVSAAVMEEPANAVSSHVDAIPPAPDLGEVTSYRIEEEEPVSASEREEPLAPFQSSVSVEPLFSGFEETTSYRIEVEAEPAPSAVRTALSFSERENETSRQLEDEKLKQGILRCMKPGQRYSFADMIISFDCFPNGITHQRLNELMSQLDQSGTNEVVRKEIQGKAFFTQTETQNKMSEKGVNGADIRRQITNERLKQKIIILIECNAGYENTLTIRGNTPPLSWDHGQKCENVDAKTWIYKMESDSGSDIQFKILKNDTVWETGDNHSVKPGNIIGVRPSF